MSSSSTASRSPATPCGRSTRSPTRSSSSRAPRPVPGTSRRRTDTRETARSTLRRFKAEEDPDGKVTIVTAEDEGHRDGFWPGEKDEQSRVYARRATGDYLWQVDIDEFYLADDMERVVAMLEADPAIDAMTFQADHVLGWPGLRRRRLVSAAGRGRLSPTLPLGTGLRVPDPPAADRRRPRRARPPGGALARRRGDGRARHPALPLLAAPAQAGHREVRLLRQRRLGPTDRRRRMGERGLPRDSTGRSGSTTSTPIRAGWSATPARTRSR